MTEQHNEDSTFLHYNMPINKCAAIHKARQDSNSQTTLIRVDFCDSCNFNLQLLQLRAYVVKPWRGPIA